MLGIGVALNSLPVYWFGGSGGGVLPSTGSRLASALNRRAETLAPSTATQLNAWCRHKIIIGSNNFSSIQLSFPATIFGNGDLNVGNDYQIFQCAFEKETGGAAYVPVTFNGQSSVKVKDGSTEVYCDPILPSAFGLANFAQGSVFYVRAMLIMSGAGKNIPVCQLANGLNDPNCTTLVHNPITCSAGPIYGTGGPSYGTGTGGTGPSDYTFAALYCPIAIGVPVTGTGKYIAGIGDSIVSGTGETAGGGTGGWYYGFFTRSLVNADFTTGVRAGINFGWPGANADQWTFAAPASKKLLSFANVTVEEYGTNGAQYANSSSIWAYAKSIGHQVVRTKLLTITTSSDGWSNATPPTNQTKVAAWTTPTGDRAIFNAACLAQNGSLFDAYANFDSSVLYSLDRDYWQTPGATADGTHPTSAKHEAMAAVMRTVYAALP